MKKIITIAFVGMFGVLTLGSCYKTRNCQCTTVYNSASGSAGTSETSNQAVFGLKSGAKASCAAFESNSSYSTTSCKLTK